MTADMTDYDPVAAVTTQLADGGYRVTRAAGGWIAQCPAHDDRNPSLSIAAGADGRLLLHCHAGCGIRDILDALGLPPAAMFTDYQPDRPGTVTHLNHVRAWRRPQPAAAPRPKPHRREKTHHWDYHDRHGAIVARVVRYNLVDVDTGEIAGKTFTQHAWADGRQQPNLGGLDMPLYRLPTVLAAAMQDRPVYVVEGERDADTLAALGLTATTCPMGAGSWRPWHTEALSGAADVRIIADNDEPGLAHARHIADELGAAATILLPADGCKDATEHFDAGHTLDDLVMLGEPDPAAAVRDAFPALDWHALWADDSEEEWIVEPILPARRLVALYSPPKVGKSLLLLEIAVAVAQGADVLGTSPDRPRRVLYVDFENDPKLDTRDRLKAMGHTPADLENLVVLSFPTMAALDTPAGGAELLAAVAAYECEVVAIDTVSRSIRGEENENDTWLNFYRHTGLALKQAQVSLIRLDHTGKDETKGQRGGSAKSGDVDAVWRMSKVTDTTFKLECEAARLPITEKTLVIHRETAPVLRHRVDAAGVMAVKRTKVDDLVEWLDANGLPDAASNREIRDLLAQRGRKVRKDISEEACRVRHGRIRAWEPGDERA